MSFLQYIVLNSLVISAALFFKTIEILKEKMTDSQKHILFSLLGKTPQILTETLYCLMIHQKIPITEIKVITTEECYEIVCEKLLNSKTGRFYTFCQDWNIDTRKIEFGPENILVAPELPIDVNNNTDQQSHFINLILQNLKELTSLPNTTLHCSLAGGRKTMSVYFAYALQFFGRPQDKLFHVLIHPQEFENHPDFYYIPRKPHDLVTPTRYKISTDLAKIELIEIPYVRLKNTMSYLFGQGNLPFHEMVQITQADLEQMPTLPPLVINFPQKTIEISNKKIHFSPIEMAFYRYYVERSKLRNDNIHVKEYVRYFEKAEGVWFPLNSIKQILNYYQEIASSTAVDRFVDTFENGYLSFNRVCQYLSRIRRKIYNALNDDEIAEYYIVSSVGRYRKSYGIKLDKAKIQIIV